VDIKVARGNSVFALLNNKEFIFQWKQLAEEDKKATIIQEPPFVITWYKQYIDKYEPVLILGYDEQGSIAGLLPLAFHLKNKYITHAGDYQAEFHGWICRNGTDNDFLLQAFIAVRDNFKLKLWHWRSLPPGSDISWLKSGLFKNERIYIKYYSEDSPILDLNDDIKLNNLKRYRANQINRYNRRGNFFFEHVKSKEKAVEVFETIAKQCDFRQMAAHESMPFSNDRNKKYFFIERLNYPENNHFTILWSNNDIVAYHFGSCNNDTVYLGLLGYNPIEEKNSPGSVLIVMLAESLRQEGYHYLDLTIGGDYKEKYCNLHQKRYIPTIYFSIKGKIIADCKHYLRNICKYIFSKLGGKPKVISSKMRNLSKSVKRLLKLKPSELSRYLTSTFYSKEVHMLYKLNIDNYHVSNSNHPGIVQINKYSDLLLSSESSTYYKQELLKCALRHFCQEDLLYTIVFDGVLAQYGWMARGGACHRPSDKALQFDTPVNSFILYDFFTEKNFKSDELFHDLLDQMINECRTKSAEEVYIEIDGAEYSERNLIERSGFVFHHKYIKTRTLGFVKIKEK
jgi:CelD/BcsL family acetyltransferase involved in cellulose biosynthesis